MVLNWLSQRGMPFPRNPRVTGKAPDKAGREREELLPGLVLALAVLGKEVTRDDILSPACPGFQELWLRALGHPQRWRGL